MLPVLDGIDFVVNPGEILSVVGKSGCGKTTLLNILSGLLEPTEGWVSHAGTLGYVSQKDLLLPWRNIIENILLPLEIRHSLDATSVLRARELLRQFGLETFAAAYPHEISGGMRQKVSLIRSFMQDPKIFLGLRDSQYRGSHLGRGYGHGARIATGTHPLPSRRACAGSRSKAHPHTEDGSVR